MIKVKVVLEVVVDDKNIINLYPNYRFNWNSPEEFIQSRILDAGTKDINIVTGEPQKHLEAFGYSMKALDLKIPDNIDDLNEISNDIVSRLVSEDLIPDCTDTDDQTEFEIQDVINEKLAELFGLDYENLQE